MHTVVYLQTDVKCIYTVCILANTKLYACIQMSTLNFILCTVSAESPSEKLKTAVLIVSLTWKLGRRGPLDGKWVVQVVRVQEQIQKQVQTSGDTSTSTRASAKL